MDYLVTITHTAGTMSQLRTYLVKGAPSKKAAGAAAWKQAKTHTKKYGKPTAIESVGDRGTGALTDVFTKAPKEDRGVRLSSTQLTGGLLTLIGQWRERHEQQTGKRFIAATSKGLLFKPANRRGTDFISWEDVASEGRFYRKEAQGNPPPTSTWWDSIDY